MSSTLGQIFKISTWGESHGVGVGVNIDGCPPMLEITQEEIQKELDRRRPGQSDIVTPRKEGDVCEILSGVFEGKTLGSPIGILVRNKDQRPSSYNEMKDKYRPSHADYTYDAKYGIRAWHGGGRASARETIGRVAAAAVAKKVIHSICPDIEVIAYVKSIKHLEAKVDPNTVQFDDVESNIVRTGDPAMVEPMIELIKEVRGQGNSIGGVVECVVRNCPAGLGAPVFDKLEAELAKAMMSIPATKGFEIGSGFDGTQLTGVEHNDHFYMEDGKVRTKTNNSGGIQGGISNGENIIFRVAFKPTATIMTEQPTVDSNLKETELKGRGRHDACVLPRAVPMVEAMAYLTLVDHILRQRAQVGSIGPQV
ncbi:chorismate synthase [Rubritalea marina]|uniref:chorismate synthase n=1 Tax=Rubritalea marina TaxID=361055 RepID=UPI00035F33F6|nr:chorismate synthase [Rubritalea marina]